MVTRLELSVSHVVFLHVHKGGIRICFGIAVAGVAHRKQLLLVIFPSCKQVVYLFPCPLLRGFPPTSAMDNTSEDLLRQRLQSWVQGKTLILITHRASMLSLVDRLAVLDNGHVVADGPKDAVIEALRKGRVGPASL